MWMKTLSFLDSYHGILVNEDTSPKAFVTMLCDVREL